MTIADTSGRMHMSICTVDVDQAFEACTASRVGECWQYVAKKYQGLHGTDKIAVGKGRLDVSKPCKGSGPAWWFLSVSMVTRALLAFTRLTLVIAVGVIWEMRG